MNTLDTEPFFSSEAQQSFVAGERVFVIHDLKEAAPLGKGAEGVYAGQFAGLAVVDWDTPSGEPWRCAVAFSGIKSLFR